MKLVKKIIVGDIASNIDAIPDQSGIYAFYLRMNDLNTSSLEQYGKFFQVQAMSIEITQQPKNKDWNLASYLSSKFIHDNLPNSTPFKDGLIGEIKSNHDKLLEIATELFTPPIYIGSTGDLRRRIKEHLEDIGIINPQSSYSNEKSFGNRLIEITKNNDFFNTNNMILKYIFDESEELTKNDFEVIEKYMLSTVKPILSLK